MKLRVTLFIILFSSLTSFSQQFADKNIYLVDSLIVEELDPVDQELIHEALKLYSEAKHDTDKVNAINLIVDESYDHNLWFKYNEWVYDFIQDQKKETSVEDRFYAYTKGNYWNNRGVYYSKIGIIDSVKVNYDRGLELSEKLGDISGMASAFNNIGMWYDRQGNLPLAMDYYLKSVQFHEKSDPGSGLVTVTANLGMLYSTQGQNDKARYYFERGLKISEEIKNEEDIAYSSNSLGRLLNEEGKPLEALKYYLKALEINKVIGYKSGVSTNLHNIGGVYEDLDSLELALDFFNKSLKIAEDLDNIRGIPSALIRIAWIKLESGNISESEKDGLRAYQIAQDVQNINDIKTAANFLTALYKEKNDAKKELLYYKEFILLSDSISSLSNAKKLIEVQFQDQYDKKALKDSIIQADSKKVSDAQIEAGNLKIAAQDRQKWYLFGVLGLFALFSIFIFNRFKAAKKKKLIIEKQKMQVDEAFLELEEKNREITDSITYAKRIQSAILPPKQLVSSYLENSFILYKPKDIVAGDFYWMEPTSDMVLFAAADCTGHGVPGAMVSVICNNGLNRAVREHKLTDPGLILDKTREIVIAEFEKSEDDVKDGMDIALCSLKGRTLTYAGAHNPLWIIRKGAEEVEEIKADKQPIGNFANIAPYTTHEIELNEGDAFYIFSDGYADQFGGERNKKFKSVNFKRLLLSVQHLSMTEQKEKIDQTFESWRIETEQLDDVCVIGVKL